MGALGWCFSFSEIGYFQVNQPLVFVGGGGTYIFKTSKKISGGESCFCGGGEPNFL